MCIYIYIDLLLGRLIRYKKQVILFRNIYYSTALMIFGVNFSYSKRLQLQH